MAVPLREMGVVVVMGPTELVIEVLALIDGVMLGVVELLPAGKDLEMMGGAVDVRLPPPVDEVMTGDTIGLEVVSL